MFAATVSPTPACLELELLSGPRAGQRFLLEPGEHTLGRSLGASLTLPVAGLSRQHAMLRVDDDGRCFVRDLRSTNGTHLNGARIGEQDHPLYDGDEISLGRRLTLRLSVPTLPDDDPSASYDPISGAHDSRHLATRVDRLVRSACRRQRPLALAVVDIDRLRRINTVHGPDAGDEALRHLAERLQQAVGPRGLVARRDEDSFVVVAPLSADDAHARLQEALSGLRIHADDTVVLFHATAGISAIEELPRCCAADLFVQATARMIAEKQKRRQEP